MFRKKNDEEVKNLREQVENLKEQLNELSKKLEAQKDESKKEEAPPQPQPQPQPKPTEYDFDFDDFGERMGEFGERMGEFGERIGEYVSNLVEGVMKNVMSDLDRSFSLRSHTSRPERAAEKEAVKADSKAAADLMSALGHENRITILSELVSGGRYASDLQEKLPDIGASTLSSHLDVLEKAGLIVQEKARGRYLITMPGRLAYEMANEITKQAEKNSL
jgi:DNA-binding transcriptional ArsR family regulator